MEDCLGHSRIERELDLAHPARRDGKCEDEGDDCGLQGDDCGAEGGECTGNEGEEPEESAEYDEAVEVPCGVICEHAAMPFQFVFPGALFFASVFVGLRWYVCECLEIVSAVKAWRSKAYISGLSHFVFLL